MTTKQKEIFIIIKEYIDEYGFSPSIRDLCDITGKKSPATIHYYLKNLKKQGYIDYIYNRNRTIRIIKG